MKTPSFTVEAGEHYAPPVRRNPRGKVRFLLGGLLAFLALNAFGGGYYGLSGAKGVPTEWLEGSPFHDYFVPSLILFVVVGGSSALAAVAVFARWRIARLLALSAGAIVLGWLTVQVFIIGYVSWMQPATAIVAASILSLAWWLPGSGACAGPGWKKSSRRQEPVHQS